jgi:hypothetical protein
MIKIARGPLPVSLDLTRENSAASKERRKHLALLNSGTPLSDIEFKFTAYNTSIVKSAICLLTNERCGYCGVKLEPVDLSIEHYRPKAMVLTEQGRIKPGYYWLGSSWGNLYPTCSLCNGTNKVEVLDGGKVERVVGKGNYFPILNDRRNNVLDVGCENNEIPLLFQPSVDDPDDLFDYEFKIIDNRGCCLIKPAQHLVDPYEVLKARESIKVFGLNSINRCEARYKKIEFCNNAMKSLQKKIQNVDLDLKNDIGDVLYFVIKDSRSSYIGLLRRLFRPFSFRLYHYLALHNLVQSLPRLEYKCVLELLVEYSSDAEYLYDLSIPQGL